MMDLSEAKSLGATVASKKGRIKAITVQAKACVPYEWIYTSTTEPSAKPISSSNHFGIDLGSMNKNNK